MTKSRLPQAPFGDGRSRVHIENVRPEMDGGRHPVKRIEGDIVTVTADLICDGHEVLRGLLLYRHEDEETFLETPLESMGNDRYSASFVAARMGVYQFTVEGFIDVFATYRRSLARKAEANQDVSLELLEGAVLLASMALRAGPSEQALLRNAADMLGGSASASERVKLALSPDLAEAALRVPDRTLATRHSRLLEIAVDPKRARFSAWYELFPRSAGLPGQHGTLADVEARLPYIADMGFDILYLPPIHPIGVSFRKGPNNTPTAGPGDPGSPWAIGGEGGGHTSVHPQLGTVEDLRRLVGKARALGIELALDIAFQTSPDHPWVHEHPEWFRRRPDGSIQYAENPPKKYQDVYPFDFECEAWEALWEALRDVFLFWIGHGVKVFRVDNPHTKPVPFWAWCIRTIKQQHPEVIFLAEAFTRPKMMYALAKVGFSQSYTYFTWRTTKREIEAYMRELVHTEVAEFFRPNFWPNTPDILPEHLQHGGRPMFISRLVLAATLSSNYGIYGPVFELLEHVARPGAEEYLGSEKYEIRNWDLSREDSLCHVIARCNRIRRAHPALASNDSLRFHRTDNELIMAYSKSAAAGGDIILVVVNLDPHHKHFAWLELDLDELGIAPDETFQAHDLLSDSRYFFRGAKNFVELDPSLMSAHIFSIRRRIRSEQNFEYFL